jgi:hypothetical protein
MRYIKPWIIFATGFMTLLLMNSFPVDGGGVSLIFVVTIPILIVLSLTLAIVYNWLSKKLKNRLKENLLFYVFISIILLFTSVFFPCSDSPCPCGYIFESTQVALNYSAITYDDLFIEKTKRNYPLIVAAQKKFNANLPEKIYYVNYNSTTDYSSQKYFVIYFIHDSIKSNNINLEKKVLNNGIVEFKEIFRKDTLIFQGTLQGFVRMDNQYKNYNDNGYGYINMSETIGKYNVSIRKEVENDIQKDYYFFKLFYWGL